jgi:hypothetical protein
MKKLFLVMLVILQVQLTFGQDFINNERSLLISRLMNFGFDTIEGSKNNIVDSSNYILARFNDNYCSRIEYHLTQDADEMIFCDSIYFVSQCNQCFEVTLNTFIKNKRKKWKKESVNVFYSLKNPGKLILFDPPREVKYHIQKIEIVKATESTNAEFFVHYIWVSKSEFKRLKKIKTYR